MRRLRYGVATSLDGFIAGPNGEYDWITMDPEIDFDSFMKEIDTILLGRRTFEMIGQSSGGSTSGIETIVCSRTLRASDYPKVTIASDAVELVTKLKKESGKDIWLFGGGGLFRSMLDAKLVDSIEIGVMPVLLSDGVPLLPAGQRTPQLQLTSSKTLPSGILMLSYNIPQSNKKQRKARHT